MTCKNCKAGIKNYVGLEQYCNKKKLDLFEKGHS